MAATVEGVEIDTRHWIGGRRVESAERFESISPIDESPIADVASAGAVEIEQAVGAAQTAFKTWSRTSREERARLLHKIADGVEANVERLAQVETRDNGSLLRSHRRGVMPRVAHNFRFFADWLLQLGHPDFDTRDLTSFRLKTCTSAACPPEIAAEVLRRWPGAFTLYYGLSEGGPSCILRADAHPDKLHTVGRPAPHCDIRVVGEDSREVEPGGTGEVVGRSNWMMSAYHGQPDKTAQAEWFDATGARFIRSGDLGHFDEDGFLVITDRLKDLIITGGLNIYPSDLEAVLARHQGVEEAAVVGAPSERWGERAVAFVTPRDGHALDQAVVQFLLRFAYGLDRHFQRVERHAVETAGAIDKRGIALLADGGDDRLDRAQIRRKVGFGAREQRRPLRRRKLAEVVECDGVHEWRSLESGCSALAGYRPDIGRAKARACLRGRNARYRLSEER